MTDLDSLEFDQSMLDEVLTHLRSSAERVAFLASDALSTRVVEWMPMSEGDVVVGPWCTELSDDATARFYEWATASQGAIIEAHSHLGPLADPATFSDLDVESFREWVPHVRWRLGWRPYGALVVGPTTFDGWCWSDHRDADPVQIETLTVASSPVATATGRSLRRHHHGCQ